LKELKFDNKLKQALEIYIEHKLSSLPSLQELENFHTFSPEFEKKMNNLIRNYKKPYYKLINSVGKRVAVLVFTLLIAISATVFSVEALRNNVFDFLINIYNDFVSIFYDKTPEDNKDQRIDQIYAPQYIPEGFEIIFKEVQNGAVLHIYSDSNENRIILEQSIYSLNLGVDNENREYEIIDINGNEGLFYLDKGINHIIWNNGGYCFQVKGPISKEEIVKIARSIIIQ